MSVHRSWRMGMAAGVILVSGGCAAHRAPAPTAIEGGSRIVIRGPSAIRPADAEQPLFVIEGAVLECEGDPVLRRCRVAPAEFDPAKVESIEVLRVPDAVGRYGERGRNGAIVIRMRPSGDRGGAREER